MYLILCLSLKRNNARTLAIKLTNVRESFILHVCMYDSPEEVIDHVTFFINENSLQRQQLGLANYGYCRQVAFIEM